MRVRRAVIAVAMLLVMAPAARGDDPDAGSLNILNGSTVIQPLNHTGWSVKADLSVMDAPTISGHISATGGTGNDIQILVLTESDYVNWKNRHAVTPIFNSGRVTAADVNARLPESGTYYVVLSNLFSTITPKTVEGTLKMSWQPSAALLAKRQVSLDAAKAAAEARRKAANDAFSRNILLLVLASAVVGGATVGIVMRWKKKG